MIDYSVYEIAKRKTLLDHVKVSFDVFFVDKDTSQEIIEKTLDGIYPDFDMGQLLDEYDKHAYFQIDLSAWRNQSHQIYGAISALKCELRPGALDKRDTERATKDPRAWLLGEFSTVSLLKDHEATAVRIVCGFILRSLMQQKHMIVETNGQRTLLQKSKGKPRYRTIYLSDVAKRYVHSRDYKAGEGGWKMPEHEVRGHYRILPNGKTTFVRGHKRGDPTIERKTVPIQVKI